MFTSEKTIMVANDITSRNIGNFTFHIQSVESDVYFEKDNRHINAKSILGILSLSIMPMSTINVKVINKESVEKAKSDLKKVLAFFEIEVGTI